MSSRLICGGVNSVSSAIAVNTSLVAPSPNWSIEPYAQNAFDAISSSVYGYPAGNRNTANLIAALLATRWIKPLVCFQPLALVRPTPTAAYSPAAREYVAISSARPFSSSTLVTPKV